MDLGVRNGNKTRILFVNRIRIQWQKRRKNMIDEAKMLNEKAIRNLKKMKNDEDVELAIKALRNQSVLDELLGQGLKIISSNGDISDFDKYFEK